MLERYVFLLKVDYVHPIVSVRVVLVTCVNVDTKHVTTSLLCVFLMYRTTRR